MPSFDSFRAPRPNVRRAPVVGNGDVLSSQQVSMFNATQGMRRNQEFLQSQQPQAPRQAPTSRYSATSQSPGIATTGKPIYHVQRPDGSLVPVAAISGDRALIDTGKHYISPSTGKRFVTDPASPTGMRDIGTEAEELAAKQAEAQAKAAAKAQAEAAKAAEKQADEAKKAANAEKTNAFLAQGRRYYIDRVTGEPKPLQSDEEFAAAQAEKGKKLQEAAATKTRRAQLAKLEFDYAQVHIKDKDIEDADEAVASAKEGIAALRTQAGMPEADAYTKPFDDAELATPQGAAYKMAEQKRQELADKAAARDALKQQIAEAKLRIENPEAYAELMAEKIKTETPEALDARESEQAAQIEATKAEIAAKQAKIDAEQQRLSDSLKIAQQRYEEAKTSGNPAVLGTAGQALQDIEAEAMAFEERSQAELDKLNAERDEVNRDIGHLGIISTERKRRQQSEHEATVAAFEQAAPGMGREYQALVDDGQKRAEALRTKYQGREESPEAKAAFKALQDDITGKVEIIKGEVETRQKEKVTKLDQLWNQFGVGQEHGTATMRDWVADKSTDPEYDKLGGVSSMPANFKAKVKELGLDEKEARNYMETRRQLDWSSPLDPQKAEQAAELTRPLREKLGITDMLEPVRRLPNGAIIPNPVLGGDEEAFKKAIEATDGTPEQKAEAMKLWPSYRRQYGEGLLAAFAKQSAFGEDFTEWRESGKAKSTDPVEQALQYQDEMKGRSIFRRWGDLIASNVTAGFMDVTQAVLGSSAAVLGAVPGIGEGLSNLAGANAENAASLVNTQDQLSNTGLAGSIVATIARMAPGVAATVGTGSMGGAMIFGAAQTTGSLYGEAYNTLRESGKSHAEAWKAAAPASIAAGAMTAGLTKLFPGGVTALTNNPEARASVRAMMAGFLSSGKAIAKGALDEIPEEVIDEAMSQLAQGYAEGRNPDEVVRDFITGLPELVVASGLMGGGMQALADRRDRRAGGQAATAPEAPTGPLPEDVEGIKAAISAFNPTAPEAIQAMPAAIRTGSKNQLPSEITAKARASMGAIAGIASGEITKPSQLTETQMRALGVKLDKGGKLVPAGTGQNAVAPLIYTRPDKAGVEQLVITDEARDWLKGALPDLTIAQSEAERIQAIENPPAAPKVKKTRKPKAEKPVAETGPATQAPVPEAPPSASDQGPKTALTPDQEAGTSPQTPVVEGTRPELGKAPPLQRKAIGKGMKGGSSYAEFASVDDADAFAYAAKLKKSQTDKGSTADAVAAKGIIDRLAGKMGMEPGALRGVLVDYNKAVREKAKAVREGESFYAPTLAEFMQAIQPQSDTKADIPAAKTPTTVKETAPTQSDTSQAKGGDLITQADARMRAVVTTLDAEQQPKAKAAAKAVLDGLRRYNGHIPIVLTDDPAFDFAWGRREKALIINPETALARFVGDSTDPDNAAAQARQFFRHELIHKFVVSQLGDARVMDIWGQLPKEVQDQVQKAYSVRLVARGQKPKKLNPDHGGHEYYRAMLEAMKDGTMTEQVIGKDLADKWRKFLDDVLSLLRDLKKQFASIESESKRNDLIAQVDQDIKLVSDALDAFEKSISPGATPAQAIDTGAVSISGKPASGSGAAVATPVSRKREKKSSAKKEPESPERPRQGAVGMKLAAGEVVLTATGRPTTPFPKLDMDTERKAGATLKRVDAWLHENAILEAKARNDAFNLRSFESENPSKMPPATKDGMELYLFDPEFAAVTTQAKATTPTLPTPDKQKTAQTDIPAPDVSTSGQKVNIDQPAAVQEPVSQEATFSPEAQSGEVQKPISRIRFEKNAVATPQEVGGQSGFSVTGEGLSIAVWIRTDSPELAIREAYDRHVAGKAVSSRPPSVEGVTGPPSEQGAAPATPNYLQGFDQNQLNTPLMQQWRALRDPLADNPNTILLVRLGDFYEAFGGDAAELARILEIALTKRNGVPMSGIPHHSAEGYIQKLVRAGKRVAVAEMMDGETQAVKGKREIVRVEPASAASSEVQQAQEANIPTKEVATPEPVKEKKPADNKALRAMKTYLLEKLDDAIAEAPDWDSGDNLSAQMTALEGHREFLRQILLNSEAYTPVGIAKIKDRLGALIQLPETAGFAEYDKALGELINQEAARIRALRPKVIIEIPGDGTFTLINDKKTLKEFAKIAKSFPTTTPSATYPKPTAIRPSSIPALNKAKLSKMDMVKVAGTFASTDETRMNIMQVVDVGDTLVATNGKYLFMAPFEGHGTAEDPMLYTAKGGQIGPQSKHQEDFGAFPANWRQVVPADTQVLHTGIDTGRLWQILKQASAVFRDVNFRVSKGFQDSAPYVDLFLNPDGSIAVVGEVSNDTGDVSGTGSNLDRYEHNLQEGAQSIGRFDASLFMDILAAMRALGQEKVSFRSEADMSQGALVVSSPVADVILMRVRTQAATNAANVEAAQAAMTPAEETASAPVEWPTESRNLTLADTARAAEMTEAEIEAAATPVLEALRELEAPSGVDQAGIAKRGGSVYDEVLEGKFSIKELAAAHVWLRRHNAYSVLMDSMEYAIARDSSNDAPAAPKASGLRAQADTIHAGRSPAELLALAAPYEQQGPDYNRNIAESAARLRQSVERGDKFIQYNADELAVRLEKWAPEAQQAKQGDRGLYADVSRYFALLNADTKRRSALEAIRDGTLTQEQADYLIAVIDGVAKRGGTARSLAPGLIERINAFMADELAQEAVVEETAPASIGQENVNAKHSREWSEVSTEGTMSNPRGTLRAAAIKSKTPSAPWYYQGDIRQLAFNQRAIVGGESAATPEGAQTLKEYSAAVKDGWSYTNVKAGSYGTVYVFRKDDMVLTNAGAAALTDEVMQRPEDVPEGRGGSESNSTDRLAQYSARLVEWLKTLPESTLNSPVALSTKMRNDVLAKWVKLREPDHKPLEWGLTYLKEDGSADVQFFAPSLDELIKKAINYAVIERDMPAAERDRGYGYPEFKDAPTVSETLAANGFAETQPAPLADVQPITGFDSARAFIAKLRKGEVTAEQVRTAWEQLKAQRPAILADLMKMKVDELLPMAGMSARKSDGKASVAESALGMLDLYFNPDDSISYSYGGDFQANKDAAMDEKVAKWTDKMIVEQAQARRDAAEASKAAKEKAETNPETKEEWDRFLYRRGRQSLSEADVKQILKLRSQSARNQEVRDRGEKLLTPEELARYDAFVGINRKTQAQDAAEAKARVYGVEANTETDIIETTHTQKGHALFVVKLADRVERSVYDRLNIAAKKLGGYYSSYKGNGAVPGFQFRSRVEAEQFQAAARGETIDRTEAIQERQGEKKSAAAERLMAQADKLEESADEVLNADRRTNTARRARMAASAENAAESNKAMARTMRNLAEAIASGEATHLDGVNTKAHVATLESLARSGKDKAETAEGLSYADREKRKYEPATPEQMAYASYPYPYLHKSDVLSMVALGEKTPGAKLLAARVAKIRFMTNEGEQGYLTDAGQIEDFRELAQKLTERGKPLWDTYAWKFESYDRVRRMGLMDLPSLRAALREFTQFRSIKARPDKLKEMERALIGQKLPGFFPTPRSVIDDMVASADIGEGMRVLEPSAGKGDIADAVREAGADVDVIERSGTLRDILTEKKFNIIGQDFMDETPLPVYDAVLMNPPFEDGAEMRHVRHAYDFLKPGGKLIAVMSEGPFGRSDKASVEFREWLDTIGTSERLPQGTFASAEAFRQTGVSTRLVTITKPQANLSSAPAPTMPRDRAEAIATVIQSFEAAFPTFSTYMDENQTPAVRKEALRKIVKAESADVQAWREFANLDPEQALPEDAEAIREAKELLPEVESLQDVQTATGQPKVSIPDLHAAFVTAKRQQGTDSPTIRAVFDAAKVKNPRLSRQEFVSAIRNGHYTGFVTLRDGQGSIQVGGKGAMSLLPITEAEIIDAADNATETPEAILEAWAATEPLRRTVDPTVANQGDTQASRDAFDAIRSNYVTDELTQANFDEVRSRVSAELDTNEAAMLDNLLYKVENDIELRLEEEVARRMLSNRLRERGLLEGQPELVRQADVLMMQDIREASETARKLAIRVDQFQTPQERLNAAMGHIIAPNRAHLRQRLVNVWTPAAKRREIARLEAELAQAKTDLSRAKLERTLAEAKARQDQADVIQKLVDENNAKVDAILKRNGLTQTDLFLSVDDRFAMQEAVLEMTRAHMGQQSEQHKKAIEMSVRGYSDAAISKETGLPLAEVSNTAEHFRNVVAKQAIAKEVGKGGTFSKIVQEGKKLIQWILQASPTAPLGSMVAKGTPTAAAVAAQIQAILNASIPTKGQRNAMTFHAATAKGKNGQNVKMFVPYDPSDWKQVYRMARELSTREATKLDKAYEYWINGILSGPQTHVVNTVSNALSTAWAYGPQWFAEATANVLIRNPNAPQWGEFKHVFAGFWKGIMPALRNFALAWSTEADPVEHQYLDKPVTAMFQGGNLDKVGSIRPSIGGTFGRIVRVPGRFLVAQDAFAKTLIMHAESAAMAYRLGKKQGLAGSALENFMASQIATHGSEAWQHAFEKAVELTFQDENDITMAVESVSNSLKRAKLVGWLFKFLLPFVRTPTNIYRAGIRKAGGSAGMLLYRLGKSGYYAIKGDKNEFRSYREGKMVKDVSETVMALVLWYFIMGMSEGDDDDNQKAIEITGSRPFGVANAGERASQLRQEGGSNLVIIRKNPITGEKLDEPLRLPYGRYEPIALAVSTLVDGVREFKEWSRLKPQDRTTNALAGSITKHLIAQAKDKTFLQGISGFMDFLEDMGGKNLSLQDIAMKNLFNGVIPNLIRQPYRNLQDTVADSKKADSELSRSLGIGEAKVNEAGKPVTRQGNIVSRVLFPVPTTPSTSLFDAALKKWNATNPGQQWNPDPLTKSDWFVYDPKLGSRKGKVALTDVRQISLFETMIGLKFASLAARALVKEGYQPGQPVTPKMLEAIQAARSDAITATRQRHPSEFRTSKP